MLNTKRINRLERKQISKPNEKALKLFYSPEEQPFINKDGLSKANNDILEAINSGYKNIEILLDGVYFYSKGSLSIKEVQDSLVNISIKGNNGTTLIADGIDYTTDNSRYKARFYTTLGYTDGTQIFRLAESDFFEVQGDIKCNTKADNSYILKYKLNNWKQFVNSNAYLYLTVSYKGFTFKIDSIDNQSIWFHTSKSFIADLNTKSTDNLNFDLIGVNKPIRAKILNGGDKGVHVCKTFRLPDGVKNIHECRNSKYLEIDNCQLGGFYLSDLEFLCNENDGSLLKFNNTEFISGCYISNVLFKGIRSICIEGNSIRNLFIENNKFLTCDNFCVKIDTPHINDFNKLTSSDVFINNNYFADCGTYNSTQTFAVRCACSNFEISHNYFVDYGSGAVSVGGGCSEITDNHLYGSIHDNVCKNTDDYLKKWERNGLWDTGAIYVYTQNENVSICYNRIENVGGYGRNRGIYLDNGARNVNVFGNLVFNIKSDYSIISYNDNFNFKIGNSKIKTNTGNSIFLNFVDVPYKFEGRQSNCIIDSTNIVATNYLLKQDILPVVNRVVRIDNDKKMHRTIDKYDRLIINKKQYSQLQQLGLDSCFLKRNFSIHNNL